jgi:hypothetical protein
VESPLWVDAVEKRFCSSEHARLIQDQALMRNLDSKIHSPRFDCCKFLFYSLSAATFSTASVIRYRRIPRQCQSMSAMPQPAQPIDATQALNLSAGVAHAKKNVIWHPLHIGAFVQPGCHS